MKFKSYLSLVKFSHTIFALPFAVIAFVAALKTGGQSFNFQLFIKVLVCMITARTAAMAFNRFADRKFDLINPRTAQREIPAGVISSNNALLLVIVSSLLFVATTWFINKICFFLSPIALMVVLGYSYTKRFSALCHLILGIGLALAPLGAYIAVTGEFAILPIILAIAVFSWVSGFDIIYALQDDAFDRSQKLHSIPAWLGRKKALMVSSVLHIISGTSIVVIGWMMNYSFIYWLGALLFIGLLIYQHSIVSADNLKRVNIAFFTTNGIASMIFAIFYCSEIYF